MNRPFHTGRRFAAPTLFLALFASTAHAADPPAPAALAPALTPTSAAVWKLFGPNSTAPAPTDFPSADACSAAALTAAAGASAKFYCFAATAVTIAPTWSKLADENGKFTLDAPQQTRYGAGTAWVEKPLDKGTYTCGNDLFTDPINGQVKTCQLRSGGPIVLPAQISWKKLDVEGETFFNIDRQFVRYGVGDRWTQKVVQGPGSCIAVFFGNDPAPYVAKECQINSNTAVVVPADPASPTSAPQPGPQPFPSMHGGVAVSPDRLFPPNTFSAYSDERVSKTNELPVPSDLGAFRTFCDYSHMSFDDPIVYPGQAGKSHLHVFFGNSGTDAYSTYDKLMTTGSSTCRGGIVNRSGYWVPALVDTKTGAPQLPSGISVYYKSGYNGVPPKDIHPMPEGLRMISGNPTAMKWDDAQGSWTCDKIGGGDTNGQRDLPGNCIPGSGLSMHLDFPQCWDGKNLDSPNHKDHMAFASVYTPGGCPATHPVALPVVQYIVWYRIPFDHPERIRTDWRLASDMYPTTEPGGWSVHGDWFGGWKREVMEAFVKNCDQASVDCHSHLTGDGRSIY